jgi:hypothetical protein
MSTFRPVGGRIRGGHDRLAAGDRGAGPPTLRCRNGALLCSDNQGTRRRASAEPSIWAAVGCPPATVLRAWSTEEAQFAPAH